MIKSPFFQQMYEGFRDPLSITLHFLMVPSYIINHFLYPYPLPVSLTTSCILNHFLYPNFCLEYLTLILSYRRLK